jgi:hypothetical protein
MDKNTRLPGGRALEHPGAADLAHRVVKAGAAIAALPDTPAEDDPVKFD